jgi:hypothetical protein
LTPWDPVQPALTLSTGSNKSLRPLETLLPKYATQAVSLVSTPLNSLQLKTRDLLSYISHDIYDPTNSVTRRLSNIPTWPLKILIIGDSQVREMDCPIINKYPNLQTFTITEPRKVEAIMLRYHASVPQILAFNPDHIIVHVWHNELAYHYRLNAKPKDSTQATILTLQTAALLRANHPSAMLVISAAFPRTFTRSSSMTFLDLCHYNKTVKRQGKCLRSRAAALGIRVELNMSMWLCISNLEENPSRYLEDGLHLTSDSKALITNTWIKNILNEIGHIIPDPTPSDPSTSD